MRTRRLILLVVIVIAIFPSEKANGQPKDLSVCLSGTAPTCEELGNGALIDATCPKFFEKFIGRIAFYPLVLVGPITIEIETRSVAPNLLPIFVEIVPFDGAGTGPCNNIPGQVVLVSDGNTSSCGGVDSSGLIDLTHGGFLELGDLYALRLHFFSSEANDSAAVDCVRVIPQVTAVELIEWGTVKQMYR